MSNPGYPFPGLTVERVRGILTELVRVEGHRFWPDSLSFLEPNRFDFSQTAPRQRTDERPAVFRYRSCRACNALPIP